MAADTSSRDSRLDRLALGSNCHACGAYADEPCRTRRTGRETVPHAARIDRAVRQYARLSGYERPEQVGFAR